MADASHPKVKKALKNLQPVCPFRFLDKQRTFHELPNIIISGNKASYNHDGEQQSVSRKIRETLGYGPRWLNHLGFTSGHGVFVLLKDYVTQRHGIIFRS